MRRKIKIGYDNLQIKNTIFKDNTTQGEYDAQNKQILLEKNLTKIEKGNTFLHEILHAGLDYSGLSADGGPITNVKKEELIVNSLTNLLVQVIRDNKWFLPYLNELINGELNGKRPRGKVMARRKKSVKRRSLGKNRK
ncbi:MAG: hypothetical protein CMK56_07955 [Proteobacteria bacterium]|jgi:hypothetical protein|nr:hypothetical protein [Pseudomonadota bacterium]|tara:strand:- start:162 stop:575 length:414 start_codon:yes stop_codon:yes gene_type:complete